MTPALANYDCLTGLWNPDTILRHGFDIAAMTELHRGFNFRHDVSPLSDVDKADALTLNRHKTRP